jgi:hypothetical protein
MDRIVNPVSARLDRTELYQGSARRLASTSSGGDFRALVENAPAASTPAASSPAESTLAESKPVSGWASVVTAGRTGASPNEVAIPPVFEPEPAPTLESVFGASPWESAPSGQGPLGVYYYNPTYFATAATAEKVAQLIGGKVVQRNEFCGVGSPFQQNQPNNMVELPNGRVVNPGLVATFYMRGYPQSFIDRLLSIEANT